MSTKPMFFCNHCDAQYHKWQGRCNECGKWGSIGENNLSSGSPTKKKGGGAAPAPLLDLASATHTQAVHQPTGIQELDRVLSGGIVPGSVTLLAGEPGIGKSTLVAQLAHACAKQDRKAYYVSGEESESQVLLRFTRLQLPPENVVFSNSVDIQGVIESARTLNPNVIFIDSIQTMYVADAESLPGTPTSVRAATSELISFAKQTNTPVVIIGQVTKDGTVAGPKTLEHLVDTVLTLEGDPQTSYRILRAGKNRFGSTDEVGVFEMTSAGMEAVPNPSATFLKERQPGAGSVVTCIMEGTRPFLVEIQALVETSFYPNPVRRTSGFDPGRLQMLLAIINKQAGVHVAGHDVYVNVIGGIKIHEHAADLAICAAIISSVTDKPLPQDALVVGELGLGGEVRSVPFLDRRTKEAKRLGLTRMFSPENVKHIKDLRAAS